MENDYIQYRSFSQSLRGKSISNLCLSQEDSGYNSESSPVCLSSNQVLKQAVSLESLYSIITPEITWKSRLLRLNERHYSTPNSAFEDTPITTDKSISRVSKDCRVFSPPSLNNIKGKLEYSIEISGKSVQNKADKKSSFKFRSPLKSPAKFFKKQKSDNNNKTLVVEEKEKQSVAKVLFRDWSVTKRKPCVRNAPDVREQEDLNSSVSTSPPKLSEEPTKVQSHDSGTRHFAVRQLFLDKPVSPQTVSLSNIILVLIKKAPYLLPKVFSYLDPEDLLSISQVNKLFRSITSSTTILSTKIVCHIEQKKKLGKENLRSKHEGSNSQFIKASPRKFLQEVQKAISPKKNNYCSSVTLFDRFFKEGKKLLPGECQQKCVECQYPAKVIVSENKAVCSKVSCGVIYCTKCLLPFHQNITDCLAQKPKSTVITASKIFSKACRKRLRRL